MERLEGRVLLSAAPVKDVNALTLSALSVGDVPPLYEVNGRVLFAANDGEHGLEWHVAGQAPAAAATLLRDVRPGAAGSLGSIPSYYNRTAAVAGGALYFGGSDAQGKVQLWKSDGTPEGTVRVKEFAGASASWPRDFAALGDTLYFSVFDSPYGAELWKSDGTEAGTVMVADVAPGLASGEVRPLAAVGGKMLFSARQSATTGTELWASDGTAEGTVLLKDINPGSASSYPGGLPSAASGTVSDQFVVSSDGTLYFPANDAAHGREMWKTDGTADGTVLVADLVPGTAASYLGHMVATDGGAVYFLTGAAGTPYPNALYRTDSAGGATLVGNTGSRGVLGTVGETVYVMTTTALLKADASTQPATGGPVTLARFPPGQVFVPDALRNPYMGALNGSAYFQVAPTSGAYRELWRTDGTETGTGSVRRYAIGGGSDASFPGAVVAAGGSLYFAGYDAATGTELWRSDGTSAGTGLLADVNRFTRSSGPSAVTALNGRTLFSANDGLHGTEIWTTDGTAAGTRLLVDINPGVGAGVSPGSRPVNDYHTQTVLGTVWNDRVYFNGSDGAHGLELWSSDGTAEGTRMVKDIAAGTASAFALNLTPFAGRLYFTVNDGVHGSELWSTDGTDAGTAMVKDIVTGSTGSSIGRLKVAGGTLFFSANDGIHGQSELFKTDGTAAGTGMVKDIFPGLGYSDISGLTEYNGLLYFSADHPDYGYELWRSDGTAAGTVLVKDTYPGRRDNTYAGLYHGKPNNFAVVGGKLLFQSFVPAGVGIWVSDGTTAGTVQLSDLAPELESQIPAEAHLTDAGDVAYFFNVYYGQPTAQLWKTDGTAAGTTLVKSLVSPAGTFVEPKALGSVGNVFYFQSAATLWQTDGTPEGTFMVHDVRVTPTGLAPGNLAESSGKVYFTGEEPRYGSELWAITRPASVAARQAARGAVALLPGQTATRANLTHDAAGLDAIVIDLRDLPAGEGAALSPADFECKAGTAGDPASWRPLAAPPIVTVARGAGTAGADRVTLAWPSGAARNAWLQVTVKANANTGLTAPDVSYFGNLVGDTGGASTPTVDGADLARTRANVGKNSPGALATYDFNRDGVVNAADVLIVRNNQRRSLPLFTAPTAAAVPVAAATPLPPPARRTPPRRGTLIDDAPGHLA